MATHGIPREQLVTPTRRERRLGRTGVSVVRRFAFWTAVLLPVVHVPLLVGGVTRTEAEVLIVLLSLNVLALLVGHGHQPR